MSEQRPIDVWREKLDDLRRAEAIVSGAIQKFELRKAIEEAEAKIAQLESGELEPGDLESGEKESGHSLAELLGQFVKGFIAEKQQLQQPSFGSGSPATIGPSSLSQLLAGTWEVQVIYPDGMSGEVVVEMYRNGVFRAQGSSPIAKFSIDGKWRVIQSDELLLSGQLNDGYQVTPYNVTVEFSQATSNKLIGIMSTGERVNWQRVG